MARYKPYDVNQVTLIPVSFPDQILPGSFEYALNEIVDEHIDLRSFEARYQNDETGVFSFIASPTLFSVALFVGVGGLFVPVVELLTATQRTGSSSDSSGSGHESREMNFPITITPSFAGPEFSLPLPDELKEIRRPPARLGYSRSR